MPARASQSPETILIPIKAVPGASRDQFAGMLGDRLKVRIAAPPESGKANAAICKFIAQSLSIKPGAVTVHTGHTNPEKTIAITGSGHPSPESVIDHLLS